MCSTADSRGRISCCNDDDDDDDDEEAEVDDDNEEEGGKEEGEREAPPRCSFSYVRVARRKHRQREYHIERAPLACLQVPERGLLSRALHGDVWNRRRRGVNAGNPGESPGLLFRIPIFFCLISMKRFLNSFGKLSIG